MRQALNVLESTVAGLGAVSAEHVFKVCLVVFTTRAYEQIVDQPHPFVVAQILSACAAGVCSFAFVVLVVFFIAFGCLCLLSYRTADIAKAMELSRRM